MKKFTTKTPLFWTAAGITLLIFAIKAAFILSHSVRQLGMVPWIIDDAFIEMAISRNIALGRGFSYDWVNATTGAPFLWTYLMSLNYLVFSQSLAIKMTIVESNLAGALSALTMFATAFAVTKKQWVAWAAFLLVSFAATPFFNALNGMETSLFTLATVLAVAAYVGVGKPKNWSVFSWACVAGLFAGIATLIRADGIFLVGAIGLTQLITIWKAPKSERKEAWHTLIGFSALSILCILSLVGWTYITTGALSPANQVGRRELALSLHNFQYDQFNLVQYIKIVLWNILQLEKLMAIGIASTILGLAALVYGLSSKAELAMKKLSLVTLFYTISFFGMLVAYQWYFPDFHGMRYINTASHLLWVLIAATLAALPLVYRPKLMVGIIGVCAVVLTWTSLRALTQAMPWAVNMSFSVSSTEEEMAAFWKPIDWIAENVPEGAVIGVRDHGRMAMFSGHPIQDLAGNIDPNVPVLAREGTLPAYLKERNVQYVLIPSLDQRQDFIYRTLHEQLPLTLVKDAPPDRAAFLYKIDWAKWKQP